MLLEGAFARKVIGRLRPSKRPDTAQETSRVGLTSNANLLTEQGGASARKDVAEPATKRVLAMASVGSHSVSLVDA